MLEFAGVMLVCLAFGAAGYFVGRRETQNTANAGYNGGSVTYWTPERLANLQNHDVAGTKPAHEPYEAGLPTRGARTRG